MADLAELKSMIEAALPGADRRGARRGRRRPPARDRDRQQFEGLSRIDQHRLVRAAVNERFDDGSIHALSIRTSVPG